MCYSGGTASTLVTEGAPNPRAKITPAAGRGPCALGQDSLPVGAPRPGPDRPAAEERYRCLPALCPGPTGRVSEFEVDSGHPEGSLLCGTLSKALSSGAPGAAAALWGIRRVMPVWTRDRSWLGIRG